jgi:CHAD domain-containing protein
MSRRTGKAIGKAKMKAFCISRGETIRETIHRILFDQVDGILEECDAPNGDIHKSIHEIRKSIKRIRAVLRLIREEIGYSSYYRENIFYRDINRSLSDLRSFNVLLDSLQELVSDLSPALKPEFLEPLKESIRRQREEKLARTVSNERKLETLSGQILEARERIRDLPIEHDGFEVFAGGMHRIYRQGRQYMEAAMDAPETENLHNLRKRMKYLWYQVEIIGPVYPALLRAYARSLELVSEKLGIFHDLAVLSEYLKKTQEGSGSPIKETLTEACEFKKAALVPEIMEMSGHIFQEDPDSFIQRMEGYWDIYHQY